MKDIYQLSSIIKFISLVALFVCIISILGYIVMIGRNGSHCYPNKTCDAPNTCGEDNTCVITLGIHLKRL